VPKYLLTFDLDTISGDEPNYSEVNEVLAGIGFEKIRAPRNTYIWVSGTQKYQPTAVATVVFDELKSAGHHPTSVFIAEIRVAAVTEELEGAMDFARY
jgi:hypothetical protein